MQRQPRAKSQEPKNHRKRLLQSFPYWLLAIGYCLILIGCASHLERGDKFAKDARWDEAVGEYRLAYLEDPNSTEPQVRYIQGRIAASSVHYGRGMDYKEKGNVPQALGEFRRALYFYPDHVAAKGQMEEIQNQALSKIYTDMAKEKRQQGNLEEAVRILKEAVELDDKNQAAAKEYKTARRDLEQQKEEAQKKASKGAEALFVSTKPITLRFKDTDIKEVFEIIAKIADVNVIFDGDIQPKRITAYFKDITVREAINLLLQSNKLAVKKINPITVLVYPDNPQKQQQYMELITHTFYLNNSEAKTQQNLLRTLLNTKQLHVNEQLNAIVMRDTPEKVELARKLIEANDLRIPEVEVDMEILEVNWGKVEKIGLSVDNSLQVSVHGTYNPYLASAGAAFDTFNLLFGKLSARDVKKREGIHFDKLPSTGATLTLDLIKSQSDTKVLANPKLRIMDGKKGKIHIGERRPVQTGQVFDQSNASQSRITYEYRDVGLKLTVTPHITLGGEIGLDLNFEKSDPGTNYVFVSGEATQNAPTFKTTTLDTYIKLRDGETKLLGGLIRENTTAQKQIIPFLGDIPILGRLFQTGPSSDATTPYIEQVTLLISITPRIVRKIEVPAEEVVHFWSGTQDSYSDQAPPQSPPPPAPLAPALEKEAREQLKSVLEPPPPATEKGKPKAAESPAPAPVTPAPPPAPAPTPAPAPLAPAPAPPPAPAAAVKESLTLYLTPPTMSAKVEEAFALKVAVKGAKDLGEVLVTLQYDPKLLSITSLAEGPFMAAGGSKTSFISNIDQGRGRVTFGAVLKDKTKGAGGSGTLATVIFKTLAPGAAVVNLLAEEIQLRDLNGQLFPATLQGTNVEIK
jgi:general secretion pathway protein D